MLLRLSRAFTQTAAKWENEIQFQATKSTLSHISGSEFCIIKVLGSVFSALSLGLGFLEIV